MIREDLLEFKYYLQRLSKFMQESYGITDQVKTFQTWLKQIDKYYDDFFTELNILKYNYQDGNALLDKIGAIFGCYRKFTIPIYDPVTQKLTNQFYEINLNDQDYLDYIKTQIIKQNFNGTREVLQSLYSSYYNGKLEEKLIPLIFLYTTEEDENGAVCTIRWDVDNPSTDLAILFENGYLTIESVGVRYNYQITNLSRLAYYYDPNKPITKYQYYYAQAYDLLTTEPSGWNSHYNDYFTIVATPNLQEEWDPTKTYYRLSNGGYVLLEERPSDWADYWGTYYLLTITPNTNPTWATNTYYEFLERGGLYS